MADFGFSSWLGLGSGLGAQEASSAGEPSRQQPVPSHPSAGDSLLPKVAASDALAAALTKGVASASAEKTPFKGMPLPPQGGTFDPDSVPSPDIQQLRVITLTKVHTDYRESLSTQVAANGSYIAYGLQQGHVRVRSKESAGAALLKGHTTSITDMQFCWCSNTLASCDSTGTVHVRSISEAEGSIQDEMLFNQCFGENTRASRRLCWHPDLENLLAVAASDRVAFVNVPPTVGVASFPEFSQPVTPDQPHTEGSLVCLAFSRKGDLLAAADTLGYVHVWTLPQDFAQKPKYEPLAAKADLVFKAYEGEEGACVGVLDFLPSSGKTQVLVTGDGTCSSLRLWCLRLGQTEGSTLEAECTYKLQIVSPEGVFNHLLVVPTLSALVLANTKKQQVYVIHVHQDPSSGHAACDFVSVSSVMMPILSVNASTEGVTQDVLGANVFRLYTVQTEAIQEYTLYTDACFPAEDLEEDAQRQQQIYQETHPHLPHSPPVIPPTVHVPHILEQPFTMPQPPEPSMPQAVEATDASAPTDSTAPAEVIGETRPEQPPAEASESAGTSAAPSAPPSGAEPGPSTARALPAAMEAAVSSPPPPPPLMLSAGVLQAAGRRGSVTRSPEPEQLPIHLPDRPSTPSTITQIKGHRAGSPDSSDSDATSPAPPFATALFGHAATPAGTPATPAHAVGGATSSAGHASPPAPVVPSPQPQGSLGGSRHSSSGSIDNTARTAETPAETPVPRPDSLPRPASPTAQPVSSGNSTDAVGQVTPHMVTQVSEAAAGDSGARAGRKHVRAARGSKAAKEAGTPAAGASNGSSAGPPPLPSPNLLQRGSNPLPPSVGSNLLMSTPLGDSTGAVGTPPPPQALHLLTHGSVEASPVVMGSTTGTQNDPLQKLLTQMASQQRQTLSTFKAEISRELAAAQKAHEAAIKQLLDRHLKSSEAAEAKAAQRDRDEVVKGVSGAVQGVSRDLGSRLSDLQRSLPAQVASSTSTAIKAASAEALPAAAQQAVDRAVERAVRAALPRAVNDALREVMTSSLIPAFEKATQAMFGQVEQALSSGLTQHLKSAAEAAQGLGTVQTQLVQTCSALEGQVTALRGVQAGLSRQGSVALPRPSHDPKAQIQSLLDQKQFDDAFHIALSSPDTQLLSWLMKQVSPQTVLGAPCLLSQGVILSLLSHLVASVDSETETKLHWITEAGNCLDIHDQNTAQHTRLVLEPLKRTLMNLCLNQGGDVGRMAKTAVHVVNSLLHMTNEFIR